MEVGARGRAKVEMPARQAASEGEGEQLQLAQAKEQGESFTRSGEKGSKSPSRQPKVRREASVWRRQAGKQSSKKNSSSSII